MIPYLPIHSNPQEIHSRWIYLEKSIFYSYHSNYHWLKYRLNLIYARLDFIINSLFFRVYWFFSEWFQSQFSIFWIFFHFKIIFLIFKHVQMEIKSKFPAWKKKKKKFVVDENGKKSEIFWFNSIYVVEINMKTEEFK